ncbi:Helix-turn-helix of DDE superfamily endonuclease [Candidatus Rhabdochlamydia oedothoracis]|uniref:Helix-turn-helix of DDE superfamily endonuclease n=1 Tax=Candidatus Rhabdochlamydia oedothoracis TaxID=2720720 RepID=A0ABX8V3T8_9BACT|nr:hypothetical protein RHOW815_000891 [Candidatus Rhabdochlamydia sp. W815]QYF49162.1 Helix-turn-helix of DDE superfamily endonuclease [Candidatus Rhabdochlamydia oedothoracis]
MYPLLDEEKFRRLTGVKQKTFDKMIGILEQEVKDRKTKKRRKKKISIENMLLMTLEYIREYRTYFHISQSYSVSESNAYKTVKWLEDTVIKHPDFELPGRKALLKSDTDKSFFYATGNHFLKKLFLRVTWNTK